MSNKFNINGSVSIGGDLHVKGATYTVDQETLTIKDNLIAVNGDAAPLQTVGAAGIVALTSEQSSVLNGKYKFNAKALFELFEPEIIETSPFWAVDFGPYEVFLNNDVVQRFNNLMLSPKKITNNFDITMGYGSTGTVSGSLFIMDNYPGICLYAYIDSPYYEEGFGEAPIIYQQLDMVNRGQLSDTINCVDTIFVFDNYMVLDEDMEFVSKFLLNEDGTPVIFNTPSSGEGLQRKGIAYAAPIFDPIEQTLKIGIGNYERDEAGNITSFIFGDGQGQSIATRDNNIQDGHLVKWDAIANKLVDGGTPGVAPIVANYSPSYGTDGVAGQLWVNESRGEVYVNYGDPLGWTPIVSKWEYAGPGVYGVVSLPQGYDGGIYAMDGELWLSWAEDYLIDNRESCAPITPYSLDYAIKSGITKNSLELTEQEANNVKQWLHINDSNPISYRNDLPTPVTPMSRGFICKDGELYANLIVKPKITDLNGTSWKLNAELKAPAGYGRFNVNCAVGYFADREEWLFIGYDGQPMGTPEESCTTPKENTVCGWLNWYLSGDSYIYFDNGPDATNPALIKWIQENATQMYVEDKWGYVKIGGPDIQINGVSIVNDGVANIPVASKNNFGVVKVSGGGGCIMDTNGFLYVPSASTKLIDAKNNGGHFITPLNIDYAVKKALTDPDPSSKTGTTLVYANWSTEDQDKAKATLGISSGASGGKLYNHGVAFTITGMSEYEYTLVFSKISSVETPLLTEDPYMLFHNLVTNNTIGWKFDAMESIEGKWDSSISQYISRNNIIAVKNLSFDVNVSYYDLNYGIVKMSDEGEIVIDKIQAITCTYSEGIEEI